MLHGVRWNSPGHPVIYAAESFAGAMLEVLVHANAAVPPREHKVVVIGIPSDVDVETVSSPDVPGWNSEDLTSARAFGDRWLLEKPSAVLRVPGVITQGRECNLLLNPVHEQFARITASEPQPVLWDARLFTR